jgi:hypothetical protein
VTQDEIIEMAEQSNLDREPPDEDCRVKYWTATFEELEAFANLVAAKEREACAKVCDDDINGFAGAYYLANKIRARGQA